jgi:hypothetical protein
VPLYPFILLAAMFLAIIVLPPLLAAYIDFRREVSREREGAADRSRRSEEPRMRDENSG